MAVIGKIQKNSLLLLIIVGVALLAFIFTDLIRGGGEETERLDLATVWGEPVDEELYYELVDQYAERDKAEVEQQGREWDETMQQSAEDQAFNEVIRRTIMNGELDKLGITCTVDELNDMIHGNHIHPWVMQIPIFQNRQTGAFERDSVIQFVSNLEIEPENEEARLRWLEARKQWRMFEEELKDNRKAEKYVVLIKKGMFANTLDAQDFYRATEEKRTISFVLQRFTDIEPDAFTVSDEEIEAFYNEHKNEPEYEQKEARDVDFVSFEIKATAADEENIGRELDNLKAAWKATLKNQSFVEQHSTSEYISDTLLFTVDPQFVYNPRFQNFSYPEADDELIQKAKVGDFFGPYTFVDEFDKGKTKVALCKVTKVTTQQQAWVRHLLIKIDQTRTQQVAKTLADSIMKVISAKGNFAEMVTKYTEDPGSIERGGEYKWFPEGRMVPEFNNASFKGQIGKLQLVKTDYGYHIVEVLGRAQRVAPYMSVITKDLVPSEETISQMEGTVFDYIYALKESKVDSAFFRMAEDSSLTVQNQRIWIEQRSVMGLEKGDDLMRFAFAVNAKEGDISDPIYDGDKYVVAMLTNVIEEGAPEFVDVKEQMRMPALRDKQAKHYIEKMSGKNSLDEVAKVVVNGVVLNAEVTFGNNVIQGAGGNEPEVIGALFTNIKAGDMTKPIQGNTGIYVVKINTITPAPEISDYSKQMENVSLLRVDQADRNVMVALKEMADVKDNRRKKFLQNR
jgi:peptidyl-prolyl cis-trans isomerase D